MRSTGLSSLALLALGTFASAESWLNPKPRSSACMSNSEARKVAQNFKDLINLPFNTTLAEEAMVPTFQDFSDGVNELINAGCPGPNTLGEATFRSREEFVKGQGTQAPIPFEILNLWSTCDSVHLRWRSSAPGPVTPELPVTGIVAIETAPNPAGSSSEQPWQMVTVFSEFNSGAWLSDIGNFTASCTRAGLPKKPNGMMKVYDACQDVSKSSSSAYAQAT